MTFNFILVNWISFLTYLQIYFAYKSQSFVILINYNNINNKVKLLIKVILFIEQ